MAKEIKEKKDLNYFICRDCRGLDGVRNKDLILASYFKRNRCCLCGSICEGPIDPAEEMGKQNKKKFPKGTQRFPRELAANEDQKKVIDLVTRRAKDFDCPGKIDDIKVGPMVTEFKFNPDRFTRLKRIKDINEDLAIALGVDSVTVQRIAGDTRIAICVPNKDRKEITFDDCLKNVVVHRDDMELPINFGVTSNGEPYVEDLTRMPHLLVAGSTGSGKSVFLNNLLTSLLYVRSPKQLKLYLIDPKTVELFPYKDLPHLAKAPVNDVYEALGVFETVIQEMRRRTSNLHIFKAKNIKEYNDRVKAEAEALRKEGHAEAAEKRQADAWPYIVVVIDEMADMILQEKKSFTEKLATIAQMARAAGIHVIAATQRPSVDVLSGKIKVNFPARVAFRVPSAADSKTILNYKGADQLLGRGDMFYISPDKSGMQRLHAPNCKKADVDRMLKISLEFGHVNSVPADQRIDGPIVPIPAPEQPAAAPAAGKGSLAPSAKKGLVN